MFPFHVLMHGKTGANRAPAAWSLKETAWMVVAGAATFAGLALAFWIAARSVLL